VEVWFEPGSHLLLSTQRCQLVPTEPLEVSDLGQGIAVTAVVTSNRADSDRMVVVVNGEEHGTAFNVTDGDDLQVKVCASFGVQD